MIDIDSFCENSFILFSRAHRLHTFPDGCYVKRDDELSFSISGSKLRKYSSLLNHIKKHSIKKVALAGSSYSNHIVGMLQLLIENKIDYQLFLLKTHTTLSIGNQALIGLLADEKNIHYLSREQWKERDLLIPSLCDRDVFYIPEGGVCLESLYGAMTLAKDIERNEQQLQVIFDHLFIDAGTGLSAIGLILALALDQQEKKVHVILMHYDALDFETKLQTFKKKLEKEFKITLNLPEYHLYKAALDPSFGSNSAELFNFIKTIARQEGFFTDPVYSAKLFISGKKILTEGFFSGNKLLIHSGGALTLMGFQTQLFSKT